ncbi:MAG: hypothetical protein WCR36_11970 [Bacteroidaceae bacterium]
MKKSDKVLTASQLEVVSDYYRSGLSLRLYATKKSIAQSTFDRWIRIFESSNPQMVEVMKHQSAQASKSASQDDISALKSEIARLQAELKDEKLRAHAYDMMIDVAEEMFNIPIRKKAGTKQ